MSPKEIDQAIDALPDPQHEALHDAARRNWRFRAEPWAASGAVLIILVALLFALDMLVLAQWRGSLVAAVVVTIFWITVLSGIVKFLQSPRFTGWRVRRALRREYLCRHRAA